MKPKFYWNLNKRALSPIFATLLLVAIVITFGTITYFYANTVATNATNQISSQTAISQQSVAERVLIERVQFIPAASSVPAHLNFYVLNYGSANNVQFISILLTYNSQTKAINLQPTSFNIPKDASTINLQPDGNTILPLNAGKEGCFAVALPENSLPSDFYVKLVTKSGSVFTYAS
jgi:flagellin-like protein